MTAHQRSQQAAKAPIFAVFCVIISHFLAAYGTDFRFVERL